MSDIAFGSLQSVPPHYYSYESHRIELEENTRRVEEIIEEEKRHKAAAEMEISKQESDKTARELNIAEGIKTEENLQQQLKAEDEYLERLKEAASAEIERWLDYERIKMLDNIRRKKEQQILDDFMHDNMLNNLNAPDLSEYIKHENVQPEIGINLLA